MSGAQSLKGVSDFVFVEITIGLKIYAGTPAMIQGADRENIRRMTEAAKNAAELAQRIKTSLVELEKTLEPSTLEFTNIDEKYEFFEKGMSGYEHLPTYTEADSPDKIGSAPYFLVINSPGVVVRFKDLPSPKTLAKVKAAIMTVVSGSVIDF